MFLAWIAAGFDPDAFGRQTPRRLRMIMDGTAQRRDREHDERMHLAWWSGVIAKGAKTPDLSDLMIAARRREPRSPEQLWASLREWLGAPPKKE